MKTLAILLFVSLLTNKAICQDNNAKTQQKFSQAQITPASKDTTIAFWDYQRFLAKEYQDSINQSHRGQLISRMECFCQCSCTFRGIGISPFTLYGNHYEREDIREMADWTQILGGKL